ncbi:unnamed protein product [Rotaria sordida]|uniref:Uncharacterized protein n=1 Tax=Rotaria sordida TaxID=392033 RepID=A0A819C4F6_9BILA|nr:unnamed protein product [Rotaria sordida]
MIEFSAGIVSLYYVYGAAEPEHRCRLPSQIWPNDNQFNPINAQHEACLRQYIPMENGAIIAPVIDSSVVEQYLSLTFYVYGSVALAVLLLILLLPETKNVSLGDTDDNTNNKDGTQIIVSPPVNIGDIEI